MTNAKHVPEAGHCRAEPDERAVSLPGEVSGPSQCAAAGRMSQEAGRRRAPAELLICPAVGDVLQWGRDVLQGEWGVSFPGGAREQSGLSSWPGFRASLLICRTWM